MVDLIDEPMSSLERNRLDQMTQTFRDAGFREDDIMRALIAHRSFVEADQVFEFNLRAWVLGLQAKTAQKRTRRR